MKVYISSSYQMKEQAVICRDVLTTHDIEVVSTWHDGIEADDPSGWASGADIDLKELKTAHILLALNPITWANKGTGGRHVEFGYALGKAIPILIVGERTNAFHHFPGVTCIRVTENCIAALERIYKLNYGGSKI